jgi:SAM-dependent methyltransferase
MHKYLKAIFHIFKNYHLYSFPILLYEALFYVKHNNSVNKFKYLNNDSLSDSIPCPYFFLKKIKNFLIKKDIDFLCDLGSGYGKVLYFFGYINNYKIDGVELEKEIYFESTFLNSDNIKIFNENILEFDLNIKKYDLFIMNDPLKKNDDLLKLILRIKSLYKKCYIILINIDDEKIKTISNNLKLIESFTVSKNRNIFFCTI